MSNHLTKEEHQAILDEITRRRTVETYVPGKWSVSPFNRSPEVLGASSPDHFPPSVKLRDITLRTIEQTPYVVVTEEQRQRLAERLIEAGVKSIMLAWMASPHGYPTLVNEVKHIRSLAPDIELVGLGTGDAQIDKASDAGLNVFQVHFPAIPAFHPIYGSYGRLILRSHWRGENWREAVKYPRSQAEQLALVQKQIAYAKSKGLRACAFIGMVHYATVSEISEFARAVREAGVDEIGLGDGASGLGPEAWAYLVRLIREDAPGIPIGLHTHNAFGLVMACTIAGIHAGAAIAEVSVNGLCSAAGQADLAEAAAALEVLYGVKTGIELGSLTRLRRFVEDISGVRVAPNKAITGEQAWTYTEEAMREETAYAPVHKAAEPSVFGNRARYAIGPHSGTWNMLSKLDELHLNVDKDQVEPTLQAIKAEMSILGRGLTDDEIAEFVTTHRAGSRAS